MAGSFVENINLLASKLPIIEESNEIFDEGVIPILEEMSQLDLDTAIADLKKGNYLGNRKLDINLILNMEGVDETLLERNPDKAEAIWTDVNKAVHYDKAFITFVDGVEIELPFMFDGSPVTVTTHGDLLAQLSRLDYVYAKAQIDSIYQLTVGNSTDYTVTIDATPYTFTSDIEATRENIIAGIANMINSAVVHVTALVTDNGTKLNLVAKVPGNPFYASVSNNMAINTIQANVIEGPVETAFLAKLENTLAANFAEPVVGEIVRIYDEIGLNSNIERITLNAVSGSYKLQAPIYYWAKTTSAFQTLSMRVNDIIKLGNEIDNIIVLAKSIEEVIEIQKRIPQLVDTFDGNGNPNGDETIYNNLSELVEVHSKLEEIITLYNDLKVGGTNYIQSIVQNLQGSNTIGVVASDLQLGVDSSIINTGSNIDSVVTVSDSIDNVNTVAVAKPNIDLVAETIVPNINEILLANDNATIATKKALEASNSAALAIARSNEIKNVSVGNTITGTPGTPAQVTYDTSTGKFHFVIPRGLKGDKGDPFVVDAKGLIEERDLYDRKPKGFSFLSYTDSMIYFKLSNASRDWSSGVSFGKGEQGDKGDDGETGNGIVNVVYESSTSPDNLPAQAGCTDTYRIEFSDGTVSHFNIYNGKNGDVTIDNTAVLKNKTLNDPSNTIGSNHIHFLVKNNSGNLINKGTPIKAAAIQTSTDYIDIEPCTDNSSVALGVAMYTMDSDPDVVRLAISKGSITGVNTSAWDVGQVLYLGTNGTFTNVKPTTGNIQLCGRVIKKDLTTGIILTSFDYITNKNTITLSGDVSGSIVYDGLGNTSTNVTVNSVTGLASLNLMRADHWLGMQTVVNMIKDPVTKKLSKVRYNADSDVHYLTIDRDSNGRMERINYYIDSELKGYTSMIYVDGSLQSAPYTSM